MKSPETTERNEQEEILSQLQSISDICRNLIKNLTEKSPIRNFERQGRKIRLLKSEGGYIADLTGVSGDVLSFVLSDIDVGRIAIYLRQKINGQMKVTCVCDANPRRGTMHIEPTEMVLEKSAALLGVFNHNDHYGESIRKISKYEDLIKMQYGQKFQNAAHKIEDYPSLGENEQGYVFRNTSNEQHFVDGNPNIGWKLHLNVSPEDVTFVSEYLKKKNIYHKYLSGGEPEDGKIFTLYAGSYKNAKELSKVLEEDLSEELIPPLAIDETKFTSGVVGRFTADPRDRSTFYQYGSRGIVYLRNAGLPISKVIKLRLKVISGEASQDEIREYEEIIDENLQKSFRILKERYGDYFTG